MNKLFNSPISRINGGGYPDLINKDHGGDTPWH